MAVFADKAVFLHPAVFIKGIVVAANLYDPVFYHPSVPVIIIGIAFAGTPAGNQAALLVGIVGIAVFADRTVFLQAAFFVKGIVVAFDLYDPVFNHFSIPVIVIGIPFFGNPSALDIFLGFGLCR